MSLCYLFDKALVAVEFTTRIPSAAPGPLKLAESNGAHMSSRMHVVVGCIFNLRRSCIQDQKQGLVHSQAFISRLLNMLLSETYFQLLPRSCFAHTRCLTGNSGAIATMVDLGTSEKVCVDLLLYLIVEPNATLHL